MTDAGKAGGDGGRYGGGGMSDSRVRFEEWAQGKVSSLHTRMGVYYTADAQRAWEAWSARDSEVERLREALTKFIAKIDAEACTHEETYRGGAIWTICRGCDMKWADDRGGFRPYQEPEWLTAARSLLSSQVKENGNG
jgi:hypothetical protein